MGLFTDVFQLFTEEWGWIFVLLLVLWEFTAPKYLGVDTYVAPLVRDLPNDLEHVKEEQAELRDDVHELGKQQKVMMQVQRGQARANPQMDHERVDQYLLDNGADVDTFLKGDEMMGYRNWKDKDEATDEDSDEDSGQTTHMGVS